MYLQQQQVSPHGLRYASRRCISSRHSNEPLFGSELTPAAGRHMSPGPSARRNLQTGPSSVPKTHENYGSVSLVFGTMRLWYNRTSNNEYEIGGSQY